MNRLPFSKRRGVGSVFGLLAVALVVVVVLAGACAPSLRGTASSSSAPVENRASEGGTFVYVGAAEGVGIYEIDPESGLATPRGRAPGLAAGKDLVADAHERTLFAVSEAGEVRSYAVGARGELAPLGAARVAGSSATFVDLHPSGGWLAVAFYKSGTTAMLRVEAGARILTPAGSIESGALSHCARFHPDGRSLYVPAKGPGWVAQLRVDPSSGALEPHAPPTVRAGAGARHMDLHPSGRFAYVLNEAAATVDAFEVSPSGALLPRKMGTRTTTGAERGTSTIQVHPSGRFLYAGNRDRNSIALLSLGDDGMPALSAELEDEDLRGGPTPWDFDITRRGDLLVSGARNNTAFTVFRIDATTGRLQKLRTTTGVGTVAKAVLVLRPER